MSDLDAHLYSLARQIYPICRSITGDGVRETLRILRGHLPELTIQEVPSGRPCFDWTVPPEWNIRDAHVTDPAGNRIIDFQRNNLHVVGYSEPVNREMPLEELQEHLFSLPGQPDAIPYITSYYQRRWGFCLSQRQREGLRPGNYRVVIDSTLAPGSLTYGELLLPGRSDREILLSTYICHPSMGNNETSGPVVTTFLAKWLQALSARRFSYRIVFVPETIGSIVYLSRHLEALQQRVIAGYVVTCVGDNREYSFLSSRLGDTLADRITRRVLEETVPGYKQYSFLERGSDERQYCSPGVDLPVVSVMRSKYGEYPEYHTSLDDLDFISPEGLGGAYAVLRKCLQTFEEARLYQVTCKCEPQLGRRGLYPTLSTKESQAQARDLRNLICYCDGQHDLVAISERIGSGVEALEPLVKRLLESGVIEPL